MRRTLFLVLILTTLSWPPACVPVWVKVLTQSSHLSKLEWGLVQDTPGSKPSAGGSSPSCWLLPSRPPKLSGEVWPLPNSEEEGTRYFASTLHAHCINLCLSQGLLQLQCGFHPLHQSACTLMHGSCLLIVSVVFPDPQRSWSVAFWDAHLFNQEHWLLVWKWNFVLDVRVT